MSSFSLSICALCACFALPACAAEALFVSPEQTHVLHILASPPAANSATTKAELIQLHQLQMTRTAAQVAQALADDRDESIFIYRAVLGDQFTAQALPLTAALSERLRQIEEASTTPAKAAFQRQRPYKLDRTLQPVCKTKSKDDSYPSGHTTSGYLTALVLIEMVPEQRDAILARAADYANNRLICGVHFPSDVEAGKLLAYSLHAVMANHAQYNKEMRAARTELRRVLALPALAE